MAGEQSECVAGREERKAAARAVRRTSLWDSWMAANRTTQVTSSMSWELGVEPNTSNDFGLSVGCGPLASVPVPQLCPVPTVGGVGQKTACLAVCGMILESVDAMTSKNTAADEPIISDSLRGSPRALGMGDKIHLAEYGFDSARCVCR